MELIKKLLFIYFLIIPASFAASEKDLETAKVSLISEVESFKSGSEFYLAIKFDLKDDFDIGWINPGDTGVATEIKLNLPSGFKQDPLLYPYPSQTSLSFLSNYGYKKQAVFLTKIHTPTNFNKDEAKITADLGWLGCSVTCIPQKTSLDLEIPRRNDTAYNQALSKDFQTWHSLIPKSGNYLEPYFTTNNLEINLEFNYPTSERIDSINFFPSENNVITHAAPQVMTGNNHKINLALRAGDTPLANPAKIDGVLVVKAKNEIKAYQLSATNKTGSISLIKLIIMALLGGILLNLMPCVLPVLSLKFLSLQRFASSTCAPKAKLHGILYTLGIILSFLSLAITIIIIKDGGEALGWGFQLQEPLFVLFLIYLMFFIGLSMSEAFVVGNKSSSLSGDFLATRKGLSSSFLTGILAVFLAAPCTIPFMGTALGVALTLPYQKTLIIFLSLGLGLALPYLILSFSPSLIRFIPKPGAWMIKLKHILSIPIYLTVAWLLWLFWHQSGTLSLVIALFGLGLIILFLLIRSKNLIIAGITAFCLIATLPLSRAYKVEIKSLHEGIPYSAEKLAELQKDGQPVFLHFTADWCLLCLLNSFSIQNNETQEFFHKFNINYMVADWTNQDAEITKALNGFNRSGVPLYVFYSGKKEAPLILPEILTTELIKDILVTKLKQK